MNSHGKQKVLFLIVLGLVIMSSTIACSSPTAPPSPTIDEPVAPSTPSATPSDNASAQSQVDSSSRVDVVYFHRPQRCPTCLCFEERVRYVVGTYFQNDIDSGKMTFAVYDIGDSANKEIVMKYRAVGSQLFVNTVVNGIDHIVDVQDIWSWNCRGNKPAFDQQINNVIGQSLKATE